MALTKDGYQVKRLAEIKRDFHQSLTNKFGPVNSEPDSVIGQLQGIWAEALANIYEQAQDTYHAMYPFSAEGKDLDGAVSYVGIIRIAASPTQVIAAVYGRESTLLQKGAQASDGNKLYQSISDTVISRANCIDALIEISPKAGHKYSLNINGVLYNYIAPEKAEPGDIATALGKQLDETLYRYKNEEGKLRVIAQNGVSAFSISVGEELKIIKIGSPARFVAEETGRLVLPVGALKEIVTPRSGWDSIENLVAGSIGRERETDEELRVRFEQSREVVGSATIRAIRARLMQEADVRDVRVFENRSTTASEDGIPPHAIEALIDGGDNQKIAETLWKYKPAGIETYGGVSVIVKDDNGDGQLIRFSRPGCKFAWVKVTVNQRYDEETLPSDILGNIQKAIVEYGSTLKVGEDLITQRLFGPIYANTQGLGAITIHIALTDDEKQTPKYTSENLAVSRRDTALFAPERIDVVYL